MSGARIGLFGGTFDPIHAGHVDSALAAVVELELDEVRLLCARLPPHKPGALGSPFDRHAMVALAVSGHENLVADARELLRDGRSYTIDTLEDLGSERPDADLYFLAGADSLRDLTTWRRWETILERATFVAVARAGVSLQEARRTHARAIAAGRIRVLEHEPPDLSSTDLRRRLAAAEDLPAGALAPAVEEYIRKNRLYRDGLA